MDRPKLEVADVFRRYGEAYREKHGASMSTAQRRVMTAIEVCRTAALGGHLEQCDQCGHERICYNSLPQSPLPKVSIAGARRMDRGPPSRTSRLPSISTWCSPCRKRSPRSPIRTRRWSTASSSGPRPKPYAPSPPTPSTWAPRSASSPCSTPGDRTCMHHPASALRRPRRRALARRHPLDLLPAGFLPARPRAVPPVPPPVSGVSCRSASMPANCSSSPPLETLRDRRAVCSLPGPLRKAEWVVYAKRPSPDPSRCSTTSAAIPTASPSPTTACSISKTVKCASSGKTIGTTVSRKR